MVEAGNRKNTNGKNAFGGFLTFQLIVCGVQFSLSALEAQGIKSGSSGLPATPFTHWAIPHIHSCITLVCVTEGAEATRQGGRSEGNFLESCSCLPPCGP